MSQAAKQIAEDIKEMVEIAASRIPTIFTGKVVSVDTEQYTCAVELNVNDEGNATQNILVNAALEVTEGLILLPAENSVVWVAKLDGGGNLGIVKCSEVQQLLWRVGNDVQIASNQNYLDLKAGDGLQLLMAAGKFKIKNGSKNLLTVLLDILTHIEQITVNAAGAPTSVPINVASFEADRVALQQLLTA